MGTRSKRIWALYRMVSIPLVLAFLAIQAPGSGYLAVVGPSPFRFEQPRFDQNSAVLPTLKQNDNDIVQPKAPGVGTVSPLTIITTSPAQYIEPVLSRYISPLWMTELNDSDWKDYAAYLARQAPGTSTGASASADNLLVVTPQMLVNYFKPNKDSTNGTSVIVPVGFTSPAKSTPPGSSQAIYNNP